nr:unnamed protein product [Digitaria exilis]
MDLDPVLSDDGDGAAVSSSSSPGRSICHSGCGRPSRVCLCPNLPPSPIPTSTTGKGEEIEEAMLGVLRAMVAFQAEHLQNRTVKPRVKMRRKKELKREELQSSAS